MITIQAKNKTREEIDELAKGYFGKEDVQIEGTISELEEKSLSSETTVWGAKCVATDKTEEVKVTHEVPSRGEVYKGGINLE
jgi:hypothetical protein